MPLMMSNISYLNGITIILLDQDFITNIVFFLQITSMSLRMFSKDREILVLKSYIEDT